MRIALLHNPAAGRGRGEGLARQFAAGLSAAGHEVRAGDVRTGGALAGELIVWSQAVVVAGGDGTLHHLLPLLAGSGRGVYQAALGTENLFAREFGHVAQLGAIVAALEAGHARDVDVGELSAGEERRSFAIMASLGPDAGVVHRLDATRRGAITHASYLAPTLAELRAPSLPRLTVRVDGRDVVTDRRGMVVVANLRRYALGVNPAPAARGDDGLLDVVFLPAETAVRALANLVACRLGLGERCGAVRARGARVELTSTPTTPVQADGEPIRWSGRTDAYQSRIAVSIRPEKLRVHQA